MRDLKLPRPDALKRAQRHAFVTPHSLLGSGGVEFVKRVTWIIILIGSVALMPACTSVGVSSFTVRPKAFCGLPQTITIEWRATGAAFELESSPAVSEISPNPSSVTYEGVRMATVEADPTTFTLTATRSSNSVQRRETVSRLTATTYPLGGEAYCEGGALVRRIEVMEDQYSREVIVRRLTNRATTEVSVQSPGGGAVVIPPLGSTDILSGRPLVGSWILRMTPVAPCAPTREVSGLIEIVAEISCP